MQEHLTSLRCFTLRVDIDGATMVEIDKLNYICKINGIDYLAQVRAALGLD